ncbi:Nicotinate dehydrogenase subunit A [Luteitalea pratensis]|uniref:Nicotinate dehydrogenase subunit A n=1 Tax=Luteitalea pratensis TaxID=1855912 RepID=A0A143PK60_LUTPR|nr:(2Fe-2S)-binding protein [Luteitalea pratensis]AMY08972.1 Nicotinate dehydrogenase subunit A [Luteitalea pratensis]
MRTVARMTLTVNGRAWSGEVPDGTTLLDLLRDHATLTGTKYGCGEGQCGSCTVLADDKAVRACLTQASAARAVTTIEGLATGDRLHPVQQAFLDAQAFQCGFCTPGMIMGAVALLARTPRPTDDEIRHALDGHLCRCGTYPRIMRAVRAAGDALARQERRG